MQSHHGGEKCLEAARVTHSSLFMASCERIHGLLRIDISAATSVGLFQIKPIFLTLNSDLPNKKRTRTL